MFGLDAWRGISAIAHMVWSFYWIYPHNFSDFDPDQ
jgi:hypothetical protein